MLEIWGSAFCWLAAQEQSPEGERLYAEAEEKFSGALVIAPDSAVAAIRRVRAMAGRACLQRGEDRASLFAKVCEECAHLSTTYPQDAELAELWGTALAWRAAAAKGAGADRLFAEAAEKFGLGLRIKPGDENLSMSLGGVLFTAPNCAVKKRRAR